MLQMGKKEHRLNHLLFMDDLKLYAESEEETNTLVRTVYVFSNDIGMECFMWKNTSKKKKTV